MLNILTKAVGTGQMLPSAAARRKGRGASFTHCGSCVVKACHREFHGPTASGIKTFCLARVGSPPRAGSAPTAEEDGSRCRLMISEDQQLQQLIVAKMCFYVLKSDHQWLMIEERRRAGRIILTPKTCPSWRARLCQDMRLNALGPTPVTFGTGVGAPVRLNAVSLSRCGSRSGLIPEDGLLQTSHHSFSCATMPPCCRQVTISKNIVGVDEGPSFSSTG